MDEKEELISTIQELVGYLPLNTRDVLNILVHPEIIDVTKSFVKAMDKAGRCQKYIAPWSCAKEAEARYENIKYGWLAAGDLQYEWWCEPCRKRITEE